MAQAQTPSKIKLCSFLRYYIGGGFLGGKRNQIERQMITSTKCSSSRTPAHTHTQTRDSLLHLIPVYDSKIDNQGTNPAWEVPFFCKI